MAHCHWHYNGSPLRFFTLIDRDVPFILLILRYVDHPLVVGTYNLKIYGFLGASKTKSLLSQDTLKLSKNDIESMMSSPMHRRISWLHERDG
jgi:hypothetical protein